MGDRVDSTKCWHKLKVSWGSGGSGDQDFEYSMWTERSISKRRGTEEKQVKPGVKSGTRGSAVMSLKSLWWADPIFWLKVFFFPGIDEWNKGWWRHTESDIKWDTVRSQTFYIQGKPCNAWWIWHVNRCEFAQACLLYVCDWSLSSTERYSDHLWNSADRTWSSILLLHRLFVACKVFRVVS